MSDAGFFRGTSTDQDARFADKKKKLMKSMKFGDNLSQKVDMTRVDIESLRPWITKRITELLNFEDDVVCEYVLNQLEERYPDPKDIQMNITGFLNSKNARIFLTELWDLLISAMENLNGIPQLFIDAKKAEILRRKEEEKQREEELKERLNAAARFAARAAAANIPPTKIELSTLDKSPGNGHPEVKDKSLTEPNSPGNVRKERSPSSSRSPSPKVISDRPSHSHRNEHSHRIRGLYSDRPEEFEDSRHRTTTRDHRHRSSHRRRHTSSAFSSSRSRSPLPPKDRRHRQESKSPIKTDQHHRSSDRIQSPASRPDNDWRRDLMAGRRRSPPIMPTSSNNTANADHFTSTESRRNRSRHHGSLSRPRRRRRHSSSSESPVKQRRRHDDDDYHHSSRRDHSRDDIRRRYVRPNEADGRRYRRDYDDRRSDYDRRRMMHGPVEPSSPPDSRRHRYRDGIVVDDASARRQNEKARRHASSSSSDSSSSSSSGSGSDSESSSSGSDSDSSTGSSSSSVSGDVPITAQRQPIVAATVQVAPEGPSLPPLAQVEGPALPPDSHQWTDAPCQDNKSSSSSSSDEDDGSDDSSSGDSSSDSSSSAASSDNESPEGPALPPPTTASPTSRHQSHQHLSNPIEEELRNRALESLKRSNVESKYSS